MDTAAAKTRKRSYRPGRYYRNQVNGIITEDCKHI